MNDNLPNATVHRHSERGHYDAPTVHAIIDEAWYCHVSTVRDGMPVIIPTLHVRIADEIFIHGAVGAGLLRDLEKSTPISVAVTLMDGLVLARSLYNHSANYRSVVIFGVAREIIERSEKLVVLKTLSERVTPGRWEDARQPNEIEIKTTRLFAIPLTHASAKIRSGPPIDDKEDMDRLTWSGVIPFHTHLGHPEQDPDQAGHPTLPDYLAQLVAKRGEPGT